MENFEIEKLIADHLYNNLRHNYNYTMADLRKKVGLRKMGMKKLDFFTVGIVRQLAKEGKLRRTENAGKVYYTKI